MKSTSNPRYKLIGVHRGPPKAKGIVGWFGQMNTDYFDGLVRRMRRYVPLADGGIMILEPIKDEEQK